MQIRYRLLPFCLTAYLHMLGVDPAACPNGRVARTYQRDAALPRSSASARSCCGWSRFADRLLERRCDQFRPAGHMHLHILDPELRQQAWHSLRPAERGALFRARAERCSASRTHSTPPPNRALQRAGFRYLETIMAAPSPINYRQPVTRWVLERNAGAVWAA